MRIINPERLQAVMEKEVRGYVNWKQVRIFPVSNRFLPVTSSPGIGASVLTGFPAELRRLRAYSGLARSAHSRKNVSVFNVDTFSARAITIN